jgi:digeranylgeranylglycerophospholipid reductase
LRDLIVVGAGPAGSSAARYAASQGLDVLLLDKRKEIGKPVQCGEFVASKEEVLSMFPHAGGLHGIDLIPKNIIQRDITGIKIFTPKGKEYKMLFSGFTVNRDGLDAHLASLAEKEGAEVTTNTVVKSVSGNDVLTSTGSHRAKVIVGADGSRSVVARSSGLQSPSRLYPALTCQVDGDYGSDLMMYFGSVAPFGYAWIIPKDKCANVGLGATDKLKKSDIRILFNKFIEERGFEPRQIAGGLVPMSGPVERTVSGNALLVGDAAGHLMATNGGGVNTAMICGRIAGECVVDTVLKGVPLLNYEIRWREIVGGPLEISMNTMKLANLFYGSDRRLGFAMWFLGNKGMERAIRCQRVFRG